MKAKILLIITFLTISQISFSQNWIYAGSATNGNKYYVRNTSTNEIGNKKVWSKTIGKSLKYSKKGKIYTLLNGYCIDLHEYDCNGKQMQLLSYVYYSSNGTPVHSATLASYEVEWIDVIPDSIGEMLLEKVCELF